MFWSEKHKKAFKFSHLLQISFHVSNQTWNLSPALQPMHCNTVAAVRQILVQCYRGGRWFYCGRKWKQNQFHSFTLRLSDPHALKHHSMCTQVVGPVVRHQDPSTEVNCPVVFAVTQRTKNDCCWVRTSNVLLSLDAMCPFGISLFLQSLGPDSDCHLLPLHPAPPLWDVMIYSLFSGFPDTLNQLFPLLLLWSCSASTPYSPIFLIILTLLL